jgi:hypothetical protein
VIDGKDIDKAGQEGEKKRRRGVEIGRHGLQTMREEGEAEGNESNQK